MILFTIGFTKKNAREFFTRLRQPGLKRVVDVRLSNTSQLAGFTKKGDLEFFLKEICSLGYVHLPALAPTPEIMEAGRKGGAAGDAWERDFLTLLASRRVEETVPRELLDGGCLLCSEAKPDRCHRRLVAEYLRGKWGGVDIRHL
jgi:uncharacterized protein (DUF488 family)